MDQQKVIKLSELKEHGYQGYSADRLLEAASDGLITAYLPCVKFPHGTSYRLVEQAHGTSQGYIVGYLEYGYTDLLPLYKTNVSKIRFNDSVTLKTFPYEWHEDRIVLIAPAGPDEMSRPITVCSDDVVFLSAELSDFIEPSHLNLASLADSIPYEFPENTDDLGRLMKDVITDMARAQEDISSRRKIWDRVCERLLSTGANQYGLEYIESERCIQTEYSGRREFVTYNSFKRRLSDRKK